MEYLQDGAKQIQSYAFSTPGLVGLVVGLGVYWLIKRSKYRLPPGPPSLPLIGTYSLLSGKDLPEKCAKFSEKHGPVVTVHLGPVRFVILNTIEVTLEALVKKNADFADRPVFATGEVFSEGGKNIELAQYSPTWKLHRKIAGSALRNYLKGVKLEKAIHGSLTQVIKLFEETKQKPFSPHSHVDLAMFNIICAVCFQKVYEFDDPKFKRLVDLDNKLVEMFGTGTLEDIFPLFKDIWATKRYRNFVELVKELSSFIDDELQSHKNDFQEGNIRDFTDSLILARKEAENEDDADLLSQLTDVHLRQTISDIFFAGFDTTRFTIHWGLIYLAGHPEIQRKAQKEIDSIVGRERLPALHDRSSLPYVEATLYEVMRMSSVAPLGTPHAARLDTKIQDYDVPKGTIVLVNHWALHNDPKHWKDPEKFNPERYLDSDGNLTRKPESWLPFSAGRRVCLGESVAKPQLVLIISVILHQFNIEFPAGAYADYTPRSNGISGRIAKKMELVMEKRP